MGVIKTLCILSMGGCSCWGFLQAIQQANKPCPETKQLLSAPSFVDHYKRQSQNEPQSTPQKNPLVVQAELWTAKPPKPPEPKRAIVKETRNSEPKPEIRPPVSTPKFTVIATSLSRDDARDSLALISELGGQQRWVHIGDQIGHLLVEDILNGKILYKDGDRQDELAIAEPPTKPALPLITPAKPQKQERTKRSEPIHQLVTERPMIKLIPAGQTYSRPLPRSLRER